VHISTRSLSGFGADGLRPAIAAAGALLRYAQATQTRALPHVRALIVERDATFLGLDTATRRNLELTETLRGQPAPTLCSLLDNCVTRWVRGCCAHAAPSLRDPAIPAPATRRSNRCSTTTAACPACCARRCAALPTSSASPAASRSTAPARATSPACATACTAWPSCARRCSHRSAAARRVARATRNPSAALDLLTRAILPEPAALMRDGGVIADGFDADLDELRALNDNCGAFLVELEARERERTGIANLKVEYNRVHGFYIEVSNANATQGSRRLPPPADAEERRALHHAGTQGFRGQGAVRPGARAGARKAALRELLTGLQADLPQLQRIARAVACLDLLAGFAETAQRRNYCRPLFSPEPGLLIEGGRHPVVEGRTRRRRVLHRQRHPKLATSAGCC
jgi:DNA mismatch repair protein MutS